MIPAFVKRVDMPDRGGAWIEYLSDAARARLRGRGALRARRRAGGARSRLRAPACTSTARRRTCSPPACTRRATCPRMRSARAVAALVAGRARGADRTSSSGARGNRRHKPGRGFEALRYRFEIVSDYGAFRDLQRHRHADVPVAAARLRARRRRARGGRGRRLRRRLPRGARAQPRRVGAPARPRASPRRRRTRSSLAYRIRYVLDLNAREAMHLIELRSGREGHVSYRAVALEMLDQIAAVHPSVAARDDLRRPRDRSRGSSASRASCAATPACRQPPSGAPGPRAAQPRALGHVGGRLRGARPAQLGRGRADRGGSGACRSREVGMLPADARRARRDRARLRHRLRLGVARPARRATRSGSTTPRRSSRRRGGSRQEFGLEFPLLHGNAEEVPFPDASFDLAISEYGASIWCDPYRWIPEAARLLRPGGRLVVPRERRAADALRTRRARTAPADDRLLRPYFGMHRFEWPDDDSARVPPPRTAR